MTVGIVTGAGRGMGAACADRVKDMVDVLVLVDRDETGLKAAAERVSEKSSRASVETFALDVKDREGIARLVARAGDGQYGAAARDTARGIRNHDREGGAVVGGE